MAAFSCFAVPMDTKTYASIRFLSIFSLSHHISGSKDKALLLTLSIYLDGIFIKGYRLNPKYLTALL